MPRYSIDVPPDLAARIERQQVQSGLSFEDVLLAAVIAADKSFSDLGLAYSQLTEEKPPSTRALLAFADALTTCKEWLALAQEYLTQFHGETGADIAPALRTFPEVYRLLEKIYDAMASQIIQVKEPGGNV